MPMSDDERRERDRKRQAEYRARKRAEVVDTRDGGAPGENVKAVRTAVRAMGIDTDPVAGPMIELAVAHATELDAGVTAQENPRLYREYLAILKTLREWGPKAPSLPPQTPPPEPDRELSDFERFKARKK